VELDDRSQVALASPENASDDPMPQEEFDAFLWRYRLAISKFNSKFFEVHPLYLRSGWASLSRALDAEDGAAARAQLMAMSENLSPVDLTQLLSEQCREGVSHVGVGQ